MKRMKGRKLASPLLRIPAKSEFCLTRQNNLSSSTRLPLDLELSGT